MPTSSITKSFKGIHTAIVTPFKSNGDVDYKAFETLLEVQLEACVQGIVPCGTTGESPSLNSGEKKKLIELTVKHASRKAMVIAGTGSNNTDNTILDTKMAADSGADAALVVTPYYNKPSQKGLFSHYSKLADQSPIPIILYNVPGRTAVSLTAATIAKLAAHPKIIGIKEATGSMPFLTEIKLAVQGSAKNKAFYFLTGDDPTFWPFLACGGDGVISVASNVLPRSMHAIFENWNLGHVAEGLSLFERLLSFFNALFIEANPVPLKALLAHIHGSRGIEPTVRLPLSDLTNENHQKLLAVWEALPKHLQSDRPSEARR